MDYVKLVEDTKRSPDCYIGKVINIDLDDKNGVWDCIAIVTNIDESKSIFIEHFSSTDYLISDVDKTVVESAFRQTISMLKIKANEAEYEMHKCINKLNRCNHYIEDALK